MAPTTPSAPAKMRASCTPTDPQPPEAPATRTREPADTPAQRRACSDVRADRRKGGSLGMRHRRRFSCDPCHSWSAELGKAATTTAAWPTLAKHGISGGKLWCGAFHNNTREVLADRRSQSPPHNRDSWALEIDGVDRCGDNAYEDMPWLLRIHWRMKGGSKRKAWERRTSVGRGAESTNRIPLAAAES